MTGCNSNKFLLKNTSRFTFEAFYKVTPAAIREGNSFALVTLEFANPDELRDIELLGIYFKEKYAVLKVKDSVNYQASIILPKDGERTDEKIPFEIQSNEIVISFKKSGKQQYELYKIKQKNYFETTPR
ncbi:MAG: hypothetical protein COZ16_04420 [Flavobacteriaceae bacterium CG_4_10_14_3_um_filter_31_253]|nr:MAG: hypothetical protein AUK46_10735 [Flavobacteriaceae bacterium CG2_30_31_66]PIV95845.1 MAG: hypothetical protein COW43_11040 [Flavobacteriaceae bacterium CG17_big_fil_post_rev_8_21_14_2_50_31_13]PIX13290.1 MAG: hypothetical protein COZ74_07110 [Flavobacteriaceae bacterium CG_4_8_14_3_um_filter_31_8]PIY15330.1 MAG: hypothetical protein COZ16_04420 [Flavobacteriaceae bacterium CG_4_10_14_3_um_filter_31_253]PIZ11097.1 MAG: hypothetical protein COY55_05610 [Flavobacteriaceae bacterium CG_4_1